MDSPVAVQLRYLQTFNSISSENNSTIIFPVPIDIMNSFMQNNTNNQPMYPNMANPEQNQMFQQYEMFQEYQRIQQFQKSQEHFKQSVSPQQKFKYKVRYFGPHIEIRIHTFSGGSVIKKPKTKKAAGSYSA